MALAYSWKPTALQASNSSIITVRKWNGDAVNLASPPSVSNNVVTIVVNEEGTYRIKVVDGQVSETKSVFINDPENDTPNYGVGATVTWSDIEGKPSLATPADILTASSNDRNRSNHTGTQSADTVIETANKKYMTSGERDKLTTVATNATANASDTDLRDRSTHTGVQPIATVTGLQVALDSKGVSNLTIGTTAGTAKAGNYTPTKAEVGLGSVDNVSASQLRDRSTHTGTQAISTVENLQTTLDSKGTSNLQLGTTATTAKAGNYAPTKVDVGLGSVDNVSATQLRDRSTHTGVQPISSVENLQTTLDSKGTSNLVLGTTSTTAKAGNYTPTKSEVGLGSVDNVSAAQLRDRATHTGTQPISSVENLQTTLDSKGTSNLTLGTTSTTAKAGDYAPTKADVGLGNVDNTSDANKPISTATQTALTAKVTGLNGVTALWKGTQAEYNAITTPSATTIYIIV